MSRFLLLLTLGILIPCIYSTTFRPLNPVELDKEREYVQTHQTFLHLPVPPYEGGVFVSVEQCQQTFGKGYTHYTVQEILDGVTAWLVPLLALVGNISMPRFEESKTNVLHALAVTGHLLADPIDTIWSLACKLQIRSIIHHQLRIIDPNLESEELRQLGTILFALHDYLNTQSTSLRTVRSLITEWRSDPEPVKKVARRLKNLRIKNTRRVVLAIAVYFASVVTAWGSTWKDPPLYFLHRVAFRELYYWLLLAIVLSCMAGGFPTEKIVKWVLQDHQLAEILDLRDKPEILDHRNEPELMVLNGGTYSFSVDRKMDARKWWLLVQSFVAVFSAWGSAFVMSWISPTMGLECRGILQLGYLTIWIANCGINWALHYHFVGKRNQLDQWWQVVMVKDFVLGSLMLLVLVFAFMGWFNRCWCYGAVHFLGGGAYVDLNMKARVKELARVICPSLTTGAIIAQVLLVGLLVASTRLPQPSTSSDGTIEMALLSGTVGNPDPEEQNANGTRVTEGLFENNLPRRRDWGIRD
ncbi:hypothetical protein BDD12DRAFT_805755 [Trichophaea hybrida]|nr:hypothetical protein BDD12DRAFT_805755 [Trichophaea hybrida]